MDQITADCSDHTRIIPWATERLSQQARERTEKKQKEEETKWPWKVQNNSRISNIGHMICAVDKNSELSCWRPNSDQQVYYRNPTKIQSLTMNLDDVFFIEADGSLGSQKRAKI